MNAQSMDVPRIGLSCKFYSANLKVQRSHDKVDWMSTLPIERCSFIGAASHRGLQLRLFLVSDIFSHPPKYGGDYVADASSVTRDSDLFLD